MSLSVDCFFKDKTRVEVLYYEKEGFPAWYVVRIDKLTMHDVPKHIVDAFAEHYNLEIQK